MKFPDLSGLSLESTVASLFLIVGYLIYNMILQKKSPDMAKVTTERMKILLDEYKATASEKDVIIKDLQESFNQLLRDNKALKKELYRVKNAIIGNDKAMEIISNYFAVWIVKLPSGLMQWVSNLYEEWFLSPQELTKDDYIFRFNKEVWGERVGAEYDRNNILSIENGIWIGFETIKILDKDLSNSYLVVKIGDIDSNTGIGVAIDIDTIERKKQLHKTLVLLIHALDVIITNEDVWE